MFTSADGSSAAAQSWAPRLLAALLTIAYVALMVKFAWIGFSESDDQFYAAAAEKWVGHFYLAASHWGLRHAIVLPMAAAFGLFGRSELTLVFPTLLYFTLLLGLGFVCVKRVAGYYAGLFAVVLVASIPVVASGASWVTTDLPETFFLLASVWLFFFSIDKGRPWHFILSGAAIGMGLITRETSVVMAVFYGVLMLFNYGGRRSVYLWIALGAFLVVGLDTLYLAAKSGDWLYRLHISQLGVKGDNPDMAAQFATQQGLDRFGSLAAPRWLQAWIVVFFNQNFGLLPWLGLAATLYLALTGGQGVKAVSRLLLLLAAVWFAVLSFVFTFLWLVPRYQILTACALALPLAIYLAGAWGRGRRLLVAGGLVAVMGVAVLAIGVSDRNPLFGEKALAAFAAQAPAQRILTDPATLRGAAWLLDAGGNSSRVVAQMPAAGDLYFFNEQPRRKSRHDWPLQHPGADWVLVSQVEEPARPLTTVVFALGLDRLLPAAVVRKLNFQPRRAALYRIPTAAPAISPDPPKS